MHAVEFAKLWYKLTKEMKSYMEERLAPSLTEGQLNVLEYLLKEDQTKPSDLVEYLDTTPAAVTTLLDRMEKAGLIDRERDHADRRIVWIKATSKGIVECTRGIELRKQFLDAHLGKISLHNQQLLIYLLGKVAS